MDVPLLEKLQSKFECNQCGQCCVVGGDMLFITMMFSGLHRS